VGLPRPPPGGALRIPAGKPGLSIDLPKNESALPETIAFVSPAQEIRAGEGEARTSYALAGRRLRRDQAPVRRGRDAGGPALRGRRPASTPNGTMWAFTLPRSSRQFFVYLLDPTRKHGDILKGSYIGFGETILAADLIVDVAGADGVDVGPDPGGALSATTSARTGRPGSLSWSTPGR
jgi:hypothetical protein